MTPRSAFLASLCALAFAGVASTSARADCVGPAPSLQWSFPADGDVDVPTNAKLFVLPSAVEVRVDGVTIAQSDTPTWDPGPLTPGTTYTVAADVPDALNSDAPITTTTFTFTVGANEATPPSIAVVSARGKLDGNVTCFVENDFDCADDFPCFLMGLDVDAAGVILWHTRARNSEWMPATCDAAPAFEFCTEGGGTFCGAVVAYGADGSSVTSADACGEVAECDVTDVPCDVTEGEGEGEGDQEGEGERERVDAGCTSTGISMPLVLALLCRRRPRNSSPASRGSVSATPSE